MAPGRRSGSQPSGRPSWPSSPKLCLQSCSARWRLLPRRPHRIPSHLRVRMMDGGKGVRHDGQSGRTQGSLFEEGLPGALSFSQSGNNIVRI